MRLFKERIIILKLIKSNVKVNLSQIIIFKLILMLLTLIPPVLYKILIDNVIIEQEISFLKIVILSYIALFITESLLLFYKTYKENLVYNKLSYDLKTILFKFCIYEKNDFTERFETGDIKNRLEEDVDSMINFVDLQIIEFLIEIIQLFISGCLLISITYKLALVSFLLIPISFIISKKIKSNVSKASEEYQEKFYKYESWLHKIFLGWKEVKALNVESVVSKEFADRWNGLKLPFVKKTINNDLGYIIGSFNNFFVKKLSIYCIGGVLVYYSLATVGQVLMFMKYFQLLFESIESINNYDINFSSEKILINRVAEFLKLAKNSKEDKISKKILSNTDIILKNVSFSYPNTDTFLFNDINLSINEGEKIAIIGSSGIGKSTLVKLIIGLYSNYEGNIYIGGNDIRSIKDTDLYSNISVVMQDYTLFNMSIKDNLKLSNNEATDAEIIDSCKIANFHDFICTLPEGYDTVIGEKGAKLSGGQRQKIAIARAIIKNAGILIFDETTSAIDSEAERLIINKFNKINKNKTVIIVSHRTSIIEYCDRIIKIENGEIVDKNVK